ncbi:hypothetical protein EJ08DRAFT_182973 [Tothia fuscella]|uniref:Uncharacterized protein n=1 Tax=Tothia fuscella TaxID=1048955 RepID=A0A9P4NTS7_9PEZI|nr:hypothetical protein EJ08DRAFT_182973 [Tothia fuscella]
MKTTLLLATLASLTSLSLSKPIPDGPHGAAPITGTGAKVEEVPAIFSSKYKRVRVTYGQYHLAPFNASSAKPAGGHGGMDMGGMAMGGAGGHDAAPKPAGGAPPMAMPGMENEGGMADVSTHEALKPCSDCTLKYAKASLTFPDGTSANYLNGAYLHHLTMAVVGPGREDLACPGGTMRIPKNMERMLAFHNDRNETFFGVTGTDEMGFYLGKDDKMDLELMLKNEINVPKDVVFSIEWEFIPGRPAGWGDVKGLWMDAAPCSAMMSDISPPKGKTQFTLTGPTWTSTVNGRLLNTVGHMHDGGLEVQILSNGKPVCLSKASYNGPGYVPGTDALALGASKIDHISRYSPCINIGELKKGDTLALSAQYDFEKYKPALNKVGQESHVMGVAMVFVETKQ